MADTPNLEIEMKFPTADLAAVEARLAKWGARKGDLLQESDEYFNAPDRDFAQTDEALRIRRIGCLNCVTYKGPKIDVETKTRTEIEVPLAEGSRTAEEFGGLLKHLRYRPVAVVQKSRQVYQLEREGFSIAVCLDTVNDLGTFTELEITAPDAQLEKARSVLKKLADDLGLKETERRSYLEMLLLKHGNQSS